MSGQNHDEVVNIAFPVQAKLIEEHHVGGAKRDQVQAHHVEQEPSPNGRAPIQNNTVQGQHAKKERVFDQNISLAQETASK